MKATPTELPGVVLIEPRSFSDDRGYFFESYSQPRYAELGIPPLAAQDNLSFSRRGVVRGLHFQQPNAQAKLVYVLSGLIFDVVVDVRVGSPHFGQWTARELSLDNRRQLFVPAGFAHGFCVLSATALVAYKCDQVYRPDCEVGVAWDDPRLAVEWPIAKAIISPKDAALRRLDDIPVSALPRYVEGADQASARRPLVHAA